MEIQPIEVALSKNIGNKTVSLKTVSDINHVQQAIDALNKELDKAMVTPTTTTPPVEIQKPTLPQAPQQTALSQPNKTGRSLQEIQKMFPEDIESRLSFEDKGDYFTVKPKKFLGSDNFSKLVQAMRSIGGEYISAGRDSHFRIPKNK